MLILFGCAGEDEPNPTDPVPTDRELCAAAWVDGVHDVASRELGEVVLQGTRLMMSTYKLTDGLVEHNDLVAIGCNGVFEGEPIDLRYSSIQWRVRLAANEDAALAISARFSGSASAGIDLRPIRDGAVAEDELRTLLLDRRSPMTTAAGPGRDGFVLAHHEGEGAAVRTLSESGAAGEILAQVPMRADQWLRFVQDDGERIYVGVAQTDSQTYAIDDSGEVEALEPSPQRVVASADGRRLELHDSDGAFWVVDQDGREFVLPPTQFGGLPRISMTPTGWHVVNREPGQLLNTIIALDAELQQVARGSTAVVAASTAVASVDERHVAVMGRTANLYQMALEQITLTPVSE